MKVIKLLYGVLKAGAYWFNTYYSYHINKLSIMEFTYDFCLRYTNDDDKGFGIVNLQTDDILIRANNIFATTKKKELKEAQLLAKDREKLILNTPIKSNRGYITLANNNNIFVNQKNNNNAYV